MHEALDNLEDEVSSSTIAQQLKTLEEKLCKIATHLQTKKEVKKEGAKEVVQCSNDYYFMGLDADIALTGSLFR